MTDWTDRLNDDPTDWLLDAEPWTRYRTMLDLLGLDQEDPRVADARSAMVHHPQVQELIDTTAEWFPVAAKRHDDAKLSHYALGVLAEFGLTVNDDRLAGIAARAAAHIDAGQFAIRAEVPVRGRSRPADSEPETWSALPCDAPLILDELLQLGYAGGEVEVALQDLADKWTVEAGWFCHLFFVESQFDKLGVGCPMAGLMALRVFSRIDAFRESTSAMHAFGALRAHRDAGRNVYYFGRSDRFWTFKYPFVWYNALYLADVVTRFDFARSDPLTVELIDWIEDSQDERGRFRPTSMFRAYSQWEFADKKRPSPWITFLCCRILDRYYPSH